MINSRSFLAAGMIGCALMLNVVQAAEVKPLQVLLISGGCCHDYAKQKDILKQGLEKRANVFVTQIYTEDGSTKPPLAILGNPDYAKGYDVILHDECAADINDPALIKGILAPHRAGIPGVNLHCAIHCYRIGDPGQAAQPGSERAMWFDYLGLQSSGHGPQLPITVQITELSHPIMQGLFGWTTLNEELYNNIQVMHTAKALARGTQTVKNQEGVAKKTETVVVWINDYHGTRVFNTTIGHNNATVADPRYLDLVTRGLLWACAKLDDQGGILPGYGPKE